MEQESKEVPLQFPVDKVGKSAYCHDTPYCGKKRGTVNDRPSRISPLNFFQDGGKYHHQDEQPCASESNAFNQFHLSFTYCGGRFTTDYTDFFNYQLSIIDYFNLCNLW